MILFIIVYIVYLIFCFRVFFHILSWFGKARETSYGLRTRYSCEVYGAAFFDIFFFRRLFSENKQLWFGSWTFHLAFLIVLLCHLRYFLLPVPKCVTFVQPAGIVAGYILAAALLYLISLRLVGRQRYVSPYVSHYNFFLLGLLLAISMTGLMMRLFFVPDLVEVKGFILGILTFRREPVPGDVFFIVHFLLVLLLAPYLPTHFFAAPPVILEARRREAELSTVMQEKTKD